MQMCPYCGEVYDEEEYGSCPLCGIEYDEPMPDLDGYTEDDINEAFFDGMTIGHDEGVEEGYRDGYQTAKNEDSQEKRELIPLLIGGAFALGVAAKAGFDKFCEWRKHRKEIKQSLLEQKEDVEIDIEPS